MDKLRAITLTAFQETLRRRVFYIVLLLSLLVAVSIASRMIFLRMARQAGEAEMFSRIALQVVQGILQLWSFAALFLALFLGAIGVSSEVTAKTIVHVFSRPVEHWVYLLGRWFGLLIFLWLYLFLGIFAALIAAGVFNVFYTPTIWLAFAEMYLTATFFSGVALGFSIVMPPVLAGSATFLLSILPTMLEHSTHDPRWLPRTPAMIGYYLGPAQTPGNLLGESFSKAALRTDYWLQIGALGENLLYAVAVLVLAAIVFRRRELPIR